jgi:LacI family transcriptional regulator
VAPRKKVSQQRIAADLGVSQALVSLALNGRKGGISPETYRRIWDHAIGLGYQPKGMRLEQSPPGARQRQVGFVLRAGLNIHTQGSYFGHVLHGLHTALAEQGLAAVFLGSEDALGRERLQQFYHTGHALQGVVLLGEVQPSFLTLLRTFERRIVAVSARHTGLCHSVVGNEPQALAALIAHLRGLGHGRIGWLGGNVGLGRHEARHQAYVAGLRLAGLAADPRYAVMLPQADRAEGAEAVHRLLPLARRADFPTAFVTYNLHMAAGAAQAFLRDGWKVPGDVSLAAADYSPLARSESPRLTAAGTEAEKLGRAAAGLLGQSTGGEDESFHDLTLPAPLHVGETTGPAPVRTR